MNTTSSRAIVENTHTGFRCELLARRDQNVLDLFAIDQGYNSWTEMRRFASPLDLEEFWTVTWEQDPTAERTR